MKEKYNFTDVTIGFACPNHMENLIIEECRRLCETKSGVIRCALMHYFEQNKTKGGIECYAD